MHNEHNTCPSTYAYCISSFSSPCKIQNDGCENEVDSIKKNKKTREKKKGQMVCMRKEKGNM
jgi:hypothetical protein